MKKTGHGGTSEKPKGKRRKLRAHAEKLARVAREEARSEPVSKPADSTRKYLPGGCGPLACGAEAACIPNDDQTSHLCLCTNNEEPPTEDFKCPRSTVPLTPKPIHNIILPRTSNVSAEPKHVPPTAQLPYSQSSEEITAEATSGDSLSGGHAVGTSVWLALTFGGTLLLVALVATFALCYLRRRICPVAGKSQPRVRPGEPLLAERYITNPQYGVCAAGAPPPVSLQGSPGANTPDGEEPLLPILDKNELTFLQKVGEGCFGIVHKGLLRSSSGEIVVAIKVLKHGNRSAEEDFDREVNIMSAFRHPNILTLIGVVRKDDIIESPWMVFEYMEWGDLAGVLRGSLAGGRSGPPLDEAALLHVALQVARGMQYLASRRFVHRDLAARNCLVDAQLTVKIADFGMSRDVYVCDYYRMGGGRPMPVRWMSPESILYARFTHESDVWSFGVVLWEIYSRGRQPFYGRSNDEATQLILKGITLVPPEECPRFACDLMRSCWRSDPSERIGFDEVCQKLEAVSFSGGVSMQRSLPRPPPPPMDAAGYLVPAPQPVVEYMLPLPESEFKSESSEDEEEEEEDDEFT